MFFVLAYPYLSTGPGVMLGLQNASGTSATRSLSDSRTSLRSSPGVDRCKGLLASLWQPLVKKKIRMIWCTRAYCCDKADIDLAKCVQECLWSCGSKDKVGWTTLDWQKVLYHSCWYFYDAKTCRSNNSSIGYVLSVSVSHFQCHPHQIYPGWLRKRDPYGFGEGS